MKIAFDPKDEADKALVMQIMKCLADQPATGDKPKGKAKEKAKATAAANKAKAKVPTSEEMGEAIRSFITKWSKEDMLIVLKTYGVEAPKDLDASMWTSLLASMAGYEREEESEDDLNFGM